MKNQEFFSKQYLKIGCIMRVLLLLCVLPVIVFAQSYFEASGQTQVFTLAAGAKAAWNPLGTMVGKTKAMRALNVFRISAVGNGVLVHAGTKGALKLYDVRGRVAAAIIVEHDGFLTLSQWLANGIYVARFDAPGMAVGIARLAVVR